MESVFQMVNIQAVLFIYVAVGIFCRKKQIISDQSLESFVDFMLTITLPCMIFNSFSIDLTWDRLPTVSMVLAVATGISVASYLLSKIIYNRFPAGEKIIMQYGTIVNNSGFAGLPLIASAFGSEMLFYASIFIIPNRITMWTAGISLFTKSPLQAKVKKILLNPCLISCELGILRMLFAWELPAPLQTALQNIGGCANSLSMIIVGVILANVNWRTVFQKSVFALAFVRLIMLPLMALLVLRLLHISGPLMASIVLLVAMPVGTTSAVLAQKYGADTVYASKCVFVTTILSFITVPLLTLLF